MIVVVNPWQNEQVNLARDDFQAASARAEHETEFRNLRKTRWKQPAQVLALWRQQDAQNYHAKRNVLDWEQGDAFEIEPNGITFLKS